MVNRNKYDEIMESIKKLGENHSKCNIDEMVSRVIEIKENFDIKLLLVGHFNAGKSSLLNGLMGKPGFLKESQLPQTAIATELVYDETEKAFAHHFDGGKEEVIIGKEYTPDKYSHLEYRLSSPALKEINDFILVDTPGFDAGVEAHAKAFANYIGAGSAYLVVIDQEKGGIDKSTLDTILELSNYSDQIAILINKCDKITETNSEKIADYAKNTLRRYGLSYPVYTISKRDDDVSERLISIISEFNAQRAFDRVLKRQLKTELVNVEQILTITKQKMYLDTFDLDTEIRAYTREQKELTWSFEKKRKDAKQDIDLCTERIVADIKSALTMKADSIVDALLSGSQTGAEAIILETIRPVLIASVKELGVQQLDDMAKSLDFSNLMNSEEKIALSQLAVSLASNLKQLIEEGAFGSSTISDQKEGNAKRSLYRLVTGIGALTTKVLAPWLEMIIVLLPDFVSFIRDIFGESNREVAKKKFVNHVIPQITGKLYSEVRQNIEETTELILEEYEDLINRELETLKKNMVDVEEKKREKTDTFNTYKELLEADILKIQNLLQNLEEI